VVVPAVVREVTRLVPPLVPLFVSEISTPPEPPVVDNPLYAANVAEHPSPLAKLPSQLTVILAGVPAVETLALQTSN